MTTEAENLKQIIEAALFIAGEPLNLDKLRGLFPELEVPDTETLQAALESLENDYRDRGVELVRVASGYRFQARNEYAPWMQRLFEKKPQKYTRALLETLALVAYRQPITRGEIEDVRGVAVSTQIFRTLLERDWIKAVGVREVPGHPTLFGTTKTFLDYFNLKNLSDLPALPEVADLEALEQKISERLQQEHDREKESSSDIDAELAEA